MTLNEQIYAQALLLAGDLDTQQSKLLETMCGVSAASLDARLRDGITAEDCKAAYLAAAALLALAALSELDLRSNPEQFSVGDFSVKTGSNAAAACLRRQAEMMIAPYLRDAFSFRGV